ncbi:general transcription factor IIH subunit 4-like [Varroa jacobsoni]|uniref:General transcription factor IIH subunit 4 n=1 Tax=Varroa destructor TaxID=109461 RepID=A0A7M7KRP8_VARDE|nr:general transcription factor IIH subunit 4-like isoform X2 [Varroa destructor]XP_022707964.1 general transcription factor IIH subunit 4-like [Varroa jacobsoni]
MSSNIQYRDLISYLQTLESAILNQLYRHPATCLAVFRKLPPLARHYVIRLLYIRQAVPQAVVSSWYVQDAVKENIAAQDALKSLHLLNEVNLPGGLPGWMLNINFQEKLKEALAGGGDPWLVYGELDKDKHGRDAKFLDQYAKERWDCVLHYMVGSEVPAESGISHDAIRILLHSGLMRQDETNANKSLITMEGFQFLLMDTEDQVWYFILQYLSTVEGRGISLVECLQFIFQLSFLTLGKDYSIKGMSQPLLVFLQHLREFGLVYQRKRRSGRFYPTRLAIGLASGLKELDANKELTGSKDEEQDQGYIIVETNYRVYAYTDSPLQVALISLFCDLSYRFPNLVVATLSRESVRQALKGGITSAQITHFLKTRSHRVVADREEGIIPMTVSDQLHLWEKERDRFKMTESVLYSQFQTHADFEMLRNYANDMHVLLFENPQRRLMVVSKSGDNDVRHYWKRHKKEYD